MVIIKHVYFTKSNQKIKVKFKNMSLTDNINFHYTVLCHY